MSHLAGKILRAVLLSAILTALLAVSALAAELSIAVGATTGSSLRLRSQPSTSSDTIAYLDKGVAVGIIEKLSGWYKVAYEGDVGYVSADYVVVDQDNVFSTYGTTNADGVNARSGPSTSSTILFSIKENYTVSVIGFADGWYKITSNGVTAYVRSDYLDLTDTAGASELGAKIVSTAKQYLGTRYVYGGASPSGFDCSGFTMYVYKQFGYSLPHTATGQWQSSVGNKVWAMSALQPGDLVFFCDPSRSNGKACSHVGIYIGGGQFVHSSSSRSGGVTVSYTHLGVGKWPVLPKVLLYPFSA